MIYPFKENYPVTREFGIVDPAYVNYPNSAHPGIDIGAPYRAKLFASISGVVQIIPRGDAPIGRGNEIIISSGNQQVKYCHLDYIHLVQGQYVMEGEYIGNVGWTGYVLPKNESGSHLHFEHLINGQYVEPIFTEDDMATPELIDLAFQAGFNLRPTEQDIKAFEGKTTKELLEHVLKYNLDQRTKASEFDNVNRALQEAYKEIEQLKATSDTAQLNILGSALRWFITRLGLKN